MVRERETVVVYHPTLVERYMALLVPRFPGLEFVPAADRESAAVTIPCAEIVLAHISFPGDLLDIATSVRWVQVMGAGIDALAPHLPANMRLSRHTGSLGLRMAEYAIGYVLAITQRILELLRQQEAHQWRPLALKLAREKTLGVVELGNVGTAVARVSAAIGMRVTGCSLRPTTLDCIDSWFPADHFGSFLENANFRRSGRSGDIADASSHGA